MDGVDLIVQDHRTVEGLFSRFEGLGPEGTAEEKREVVNEIIRELSIHAAIEEEILYPTAREVLAEGDQEVEDALGEHQQVKELLLELDKMPPDDAAYDAKVRTVMAEVREHADQEETEFLPKLKRQLDRESLAEIGAELERAKGRAPTRPHPNAPNQPPGIKVAGPVAALVDRIRDRLQGRQSA